LIQLCFGRREEDSAPGSSRVRESAKGESGRDIFSEHMMLDSLGDHDVDDKEADGDSGKGVNRASKSGRDSNIEARDRSRDRDRKERDRSKERRDRDRSEGRDRRVQDRDRNRDGDRRDDRDRDRDRRDDRDRDRDRRDDRERDRDRRDDRDRDRKKDK
jgi:hypothetical protein